MNTKLMMSVGAGVLMTTMAAHAEPLSIERLAAAPLPEASLAFTFEPGDAMPATTVDDPFAEGSWVWQAYGAGAFGDNEGDLYSGHFGVGYFIADDLSLNFDGMVIWADAENGDDAVGVGLEMIFRWHFYRQDRWSIFGHVGGGIVYFDEEFPPGGTELNFTLSAGMGATYRFDAEMMLMLGVQWYHISNARIEGRDRNIGSDSISVYLGVMKPF